MQKTENLARSPHLPALGLAFCVVVSLQLLGTDSVDAGEADSTIPSNLPAETKPMFTFVASEFETNSLYVDLRAGAPSAASDDPAKTNLFFPLRVINPVPDEPFALVRKHSRPSQSLSLSAGYHQLWDDHSTLQKICTDNHDPGFAYVSASFSF